jgi:hypothetical protein
MIDCVGFSRSTTSPDERPSPPEASGTVRAERYYLVRTLPFEPTPVEATDAVFAPRRLPLVLRELLTHGPPAEPVDVGV